MLTTLFSTLPPKIMDQVNMPGRYIEIKNAQDRYNSVINNAGLQDLPVRDVVSNLYLTNKIDTTKYKSALKTIDEVEKATGKTFLIDNKEWTLMGTAWSKGKTKNLVDLYDTISSKVPSIKMAMAEGINSLPDAIRNALTSSVPSIADAPAPSYEDVNFKGLQRDVAPVKLWTGQELADLHNINYDPNTYYDLIKAGTSAAVDLANYTSAQQAHAANVDDTKQVTSYLDSIRNTKANAIADGATLGARRANELLANVDSINKYATNQANVAQERFNTVDKKLLADAQANLTARSYFDQLAQTLSGHSNTLYANDTDRFGQDWLSNAEFYTADQNLRGQRAYANASMYANALKANASINATRQAAMQEADEYKWVFDNFLRANDNNVTKAKVDTDNYIFGRYNGQGIYDYILAANSGAITANNRR